MRVSRRHIDEQCIRPRMSDGDGARAAVRFAIVRVALVGRRSIYCVSHFLQSLRGVLRARRRPGSRFGRPGFERRPGQFGLSLVAGWPSAASRRRRGRSLSALRRSQGKFESLDVVAITHLHADHVSDLPALLKSGFFGDRQRPLPIVGPSGGDVFPGMKEFMRALFDPERGAFRYLSGYLDGSGGMVRADIVEMDATVETPTAAFGNDRFKLTAIGVKHGPVPALGYLVEVRGHRIAFAGDQNGDNPAFATMIKGVDILIMDHAVPEMADPVARQLHARPSEIGLLAAQAGVKQLVLSHNMARSLGPLKENLALIRQHYDGPTKVAEDLMCFD